MYAKLLLVGIVVAASSAGEARAAVRPVTVVLDRGGRQVSEDVTIPAYGGGDRRWKKVVGCVQQQFAAFQVNVSDQAPLHGEYIDVVVGGLPAMLGIENETTTGIGPYNGELQRDVTVYVFAQAMEQDDLSQLCATASHEIGHAMGLDHSYTCGDIMSYQGEACGPQSFMNVDGPCGEYEGRECGDGETTQNSFALLAAHVGLRPGVEPPAPPADDDETADAPDDSDEDYATADDSDEDESTDPDEQYASPDDDEDDSADDSDETASVDSDSDAEDADDAPPRVDHCGGGQMRPQDPYASAEYAPHRGRHHWRHR